MLEKVYAQEKAKVIMELKEQPNLSIVTDGWTDTNGEYLANFIVVTPELRPLFWSSIRSREDPNTGDLVAAKLMKVIEEVEDETCSKVRGVVTDNASNMKKSWRVLRATRPDIICNGCSAHSVNLILESVFKIPFSTDFGLVASKSSNL